VTKRSEVMLSYAVLTVFAVIAIYPMFLAITVSLRHSTFLGGGFPWPNQLDFGNFVRAWRIGDFGHALEGSLLITGVVVPVSALCATLAGYAFGTMDFRGSRVLFMLFVAGLVIPTEGIIIPLYWDLRGIGLADSYVSVILVQISQSMAFGVFWMRAFFLSVPRSVLEAARVDGASHLATLWRVLLPAARPAIGTFVLIEFMSSFNDFFVPLILLQDPSRQTLQLAFLNFSAKRGVVDITGLAAAGLMAALPVVLVFLIFQRQFVRGILGNAGR
jgi:raffinose/stachyose/melibiose transport system permease protein